MAGIGDGLFADGVLTDGEEQKHITAIGRACVTVSARRPVITITARRPIITITARENQSNQGGE